MSVAKDLFAVFHLFGEDKMQHSIWLILAVGLLLFACSDNNKSDDENQDDSDSSTDADSDTDTDTNTDADTASDTTPTCTEDDGRTIMCYTLYNTVTDIE